MRPEIPKDLDKSVLKGDRVLSLETKAYLPPTETQIEEILQSEQRKWDRRHDYYRAAMATGVKPEEYFIVTEIQTWCRQENVSLPWEGKE